MAIKFYQITLSSLFVGTSILWASGKDSTLTQKIREHSNKVQVDFETNDRAAFTGETVDLQLGERGVKVAARIPHLEQYPCTNCHGAENRPTLTTNQDRRSHWQIEKTHPTPGDAECILCHQSNDDMGLHSLAGENIEFDHSYEICAQCHSGQFKDWKIGAHGKRLSGWAVERVIQNCTGCHNPHHPKFKQKQPAAHTIITPIRK